MLTVILLLLLSPAAGVQCQEAEGGEQTGQEEEDKLREELEDSIDYGELQEGIDEALGRNKTFRVKEYLSDILSGKESFSLKNLLENLMNGLKENWDLQKKAGLQLLSIVILTAVFSQFAKVFGQNQTSEMGFYLSYLLVFSLLAGLFAMGNELVSDCLVKLLDFMKALIPSYFIAMTFSNGAVVSGFYQESTLMIIGAAQWVLLRLILPLISAYFAFVIANHLLKEDMLSKLTELLESIIGWIQKTVLGAVLGYHVIQGMIVPVASKMKGTAAVKVTELIPGVGKGVTTVAETVLGSALLIKNAIGVVGLVVILLIVILPVCQMGIYSMICHMAAILSQPVSDKRMTEAISGAAKALGMLLKTLVTGAVLLMLTIALLTGATNWTGGI